MLSSQGLGEGHLLIHAVELGFPPGSAEPTFRAASQLHPTPHLQAVPSHGEQNSAHTMEEACPCPKAQRGHSAALSFFLPRMRRVLKTPFFSPRTSPHRHSFPPSVRLPVSSALSLPHGHPSPTPYSGSELSTLGYHLPRDGTGRSSQDRTVSSDSPHLPTPFGGPREDSGVEKPGGHIVRGEDDDIAFGVPVAEHSSVVVRPGNGETEETTERLGTSGSAAHPSLAPEALLHLRSEGRAHTAFQPGPQQPPNMGPATRSRPSGNQVQENSAHF